MQALNVVVLVVGALALVFQGCFWVLKEEESFRIKCGWFSTRICNLQSISYHECRQDMRMSVPIDNSMSFGLVNALKILVFLGWAFGMLAFVLPINPAFRRRPTKLRITGQRNYWFASEIPLLFKANPSFLFKAFYVILGVILQAAANASWDVTPCFPLALFMSGLGACLALCNVMIMSYMLTHEEDVLSGEHIKEQPQRFAHYGTKRAVSVAGVLVIVFQGIGCIWRGWVMKKVDSISLYRIENRLGCLRICELPFSHNCTIQKAGSGSVIADLFPIEPDFLAWLLGILAYIIFIEQAWRHRFTMRKLIWSQLLWNMSASLAIIQAVPELNNYIADERRGKNSYFPWALFMSELGACLALAASFPTLYLFWQKFKESVNRLNEVLEGKGPAICNENVNHKEVAVDFEQGVKDQG